jgi:glutathione S-transferase
MRHDHSKTRYTLFIGTKNFSSWSLRAWLALRMAELPFSEVVIPLRQPETKSAIGRHSPSFRVPLLVIESSNAKELVWDSLAICETVAERSSAARLWPANAGARAHARSISAEMHSGFAELRAALPMDIVARNETGPLSEVVEAQITRILNIWESALTQFGGRHGFLFDRFSIADAFYAPVVTRFLSHGIELPRLHRAYADCVLSLPAMRDWSAAAHEERGKRSEVMDISPTASLALKSPSAIS